jgi:uncharacterized protein (TIGR04255 family)
MIGTVTSMDSREVYPNASVVLAVLEIRHPTAGPLSRAAQVKVKQLLAGKLPLQRSATMMSVQGGAGTVPGVTTERAPRYMSRDRTMSVTFRNEALVIETTRYERYELLRDTVALAIEARQAVEPVDGIERLGLRYIDEIRVPDCGEAPSWVCWVDSTLLGPSAVGTRLGLETRLWQGVTVFNNGPDRMIAVRYGPGEGYAVDPAGEMKRPTPPPGPFFLMDIDSSWTPSADVPEFDAETILAACDELHNPVRMLFEGLITERLRKEVLRNAG